MEIKCDKCHSTLSIPDDKIPPGKKLAVTCPKCKKKLLVAGLSPRQKKSPAKDTGALTPGAKKSDRGHLTEEEEFLDLVSEGTKLALVMENDDKIADRLKDTVEAMGFRSIRGLNTRESIAKMREHNFDLVLLSDLFDGIQLEQSPILEFINHLAMSVRRHIYIVLVGKKFKTMDLMTAFRLSANLLINADDLDNMERALKQGLSDHRRFYKLFLDTLAEVGKE